MMDYDGLCWTSCIILCLCQKMRKKTKFQWLEFVQLKLLVIGCGIPMSPTCNINVSSLLHTSGHPHTTLQSNYPYSHGGHSSSLLAIASVQVEVTDPLAIPFSAQRRSCSRQSPVTNIIFNININIKSITD
jgi:hypothetical protein